MIKVTMSVEINVPTTDPDIAVERAINAINEGVVCGGDLELASDIAVVSP